MRIVMIVLILLTSVTNLQAQEESSACSVQERDFGNKIEFYGVFAVGDTFFDTLCRLNGLDSEVYVEINFSRGAWYGLDIDFASSAYTQGAWLSFLGDEFSDENMRDNPMVSPLNETKQNGVAQLIDYGLSPGHPKAAEVVLIEPVKLLVEPIHIAGLEFAAHLYFEPNPGLAIGRSPDYQASPQISYKKPENLCLNRYLSLCDRIDENVEAYMTYMLVRLELINESVSTRVNKDRILETIRERLGQFQKEDIADRGTQQTKFQESSILVSVRITDSSMQIVYEMDVESPVSPYAKVYSYFKDVLDQDEALQQESPILDGLDGF